MHSRFMSGRTRLLVRFAAPLAVAAAAGLISPAAAMAKGGKNVTPTGSSITLNQAGQTLHVGDNVNFTTVVSGLKSTEYPMVEVDCYSATDGSLLYGMLDHPNANFTLGGGTNWTSGAAHCAAHLYAYPSVRELATPIAFDVAG